MAVAVEFRLNGPKATVESYFKALSMMGVTPEGPHPDPGCMFHWITDTPSGYRVIDVWKTKEQFDKFAQETIAPVMQKLDMPQPKIEFIDVDNYLTAGS